MKKILEINENPVIHGYSHTADFMSIAMNKVRFDLSDVNVSNLIWHYENEDTKDFNTLVGKDDENKIVKELPPEIKIDNEVYDIFFGEGADGIDSCYFFNSVKGLHSFEFKLNAMKEIFRWSVAGAEISSGDINSPDHVFRAVFSPLNVFRILGSDYGVEYSHEIKNDDGCKYMKIVLSERIDVLVSQDGDSWRIIYSQENNFDSSAKIGFYAWIGNDNFRDWYYSNFIQLHCSKDLTNYYDVKLNYYIPTFLNYKHNLSNPWLEQYSIPGEYVDDITEIVEFVRVVLKRNHYLSLHLNEKYVPGKWAYEVKDFEHRSLVYGIDDDKEQIYLMGYNKTQTFEPYKLSFDEFSLAYKNVSEHRELEVLAYQIPELPYKMSKDTIIGYLKEYLSGTNSTYHDALTFDKINWVFGISIYDTLFEYVERLKDKKITYLISEHKMLMKERVCYLYRRNLLKNSNYEELYKMALDIEEMSQALLLLCIKFKMTSKDKYIETIRKHLSEMKAADICFVEKFIEYLNQGSAE